MFLGTGFIGVDVFFVISGYLVTGIIQTDLRNNAFSFRKFYQKRVLRLAPALIATLTLVIVFGFFALLPKELESVGKHIFAGSVFLSNVFLYYESGYFDVLSDFKPLLHLWSLAIEEQFYLFWPLLIYFVLTGREYCYHLQC